jgi:hypothetical protein
MQMASFNFPHASLSFTIVNLFIGLCLFISLLTPWTVFNEKVSSFNMSISLGLFRARVCQLGTCSNMKYSDVLNNDLPGCLRAAQGAAAMVIISLIFVIAAGVWRLLSSKLPLFAKNRTHFVIGFQMFTTALFGIVALAVWDDHCKVNIPNIRVSGVYIHSSVGA